MNPIFARRSVRSFEDRPVEREKLERIARAGQLAPSAMGRFPWEILIATSPEAKQAVQMCIRDSISARVAELTEDAEQLQIQLQLLSWKLIQVQRALEELYVQMA